MTRTLRVWLAVIALLTGTVLLACSGGGGGGNTLDDVPLPSGAIETASGSFSSAEIPFFVSEPDFDAEDYTNIDFTQYEVDASPEAVIDFYQDELGDWKEVFVFSGGAVTAIGVWTRDDGQRAVWINATTVDGVTELIVIVGSLD